MYNSIGADEFYQLTKNQSLNIVDVREADEFQAGHIESAQSLPLSGLGSTFSTLPKDKEYYIICLSGGRSSMACDFLAQQGYKVTNVLGGMSSWKGETV